MWHSKKNLQPPAEYDLFWKPEGAELIKGQVCTGVGTSVTRLKRNEVQEKMSEESLVMVSAGKTTQWAFIQISTGLRLGHEIRGIIHIDVTAATICSDPATQQLMTG